MGTSQTLLGEKGAWENIQWEYDLEPLVATCPLASPAPGIVLLLACKFQRADGTHQGVWLTNGPAGAASVVAGALLKPLDRQGAARCLPVAPHPPSPLPPVAPGGTRRSGWLWVMSTKGQP